MTKEELAEIRGRVDKIRVVKIKIAALKRTAI
ncbi:hypothetical protein UFO1_1732 [Pelosinus sp. UFO1]|nr:hypothetical protein UFO1_1732 [Pelosinus sp. UFO1]